MTRQPVATGPAGDRDQRPGSDAEERLLDPDPFTVGIGIFSAIASVGGFLETRRQRRHAERAQRERFRTTWYAARRALIHFKGIVDEFETYVRQDDFGARAFRIGSVRLTVGEHQHDALRRLN